MAKEHYTRREPPKLCMPPYKGRPASTPAPVAGNSFKDTDFKPGDFK